MANLPSSGPPPSGNSIAGTATAKMTPQTDRTPAQIAIAFDAKLDVLPEKSNGRDQDGSLLVEWHSEIVLTWEVTGAAVEKLTFLAGSGSSTDLAPATALLKEFPEPDSSSRRKRYRVVGVNPSSENDQYSTNILMLVDTKPPWRQLLRKVPISLVPLKLSEYSYDSHCHLLNIGYLRLEAIEIQKEEYHLAAMVSGVEEHRKFHQSNPAWAEVQDAFAELAALGSVRLVTLLAPAAAAAARPLVGQLGNAALRIAPQAQQYLLGASAPALRYRTIFADAFLQLVCGEGALAEMTSSPDHLQRLQAKVFSDAPFPKFPRKLRVVPLMMDFCYMLDGPDLIPPETNETAMSPGYKRQLDDLERLARADRNVRPLLAVDPRRPGILALVKEKVDRDKGPFYGIKLYPKLGFRLTHQRLLPILIHCAKAGIPVVAHGGPGGFPRKDDFCPVVENFGHPRNWRDLFQYAKGALQGLYLDIAHVQSMNVAKMTQKSSEDSGRDFSEGRGRFFQCNNFTDHRSTHHDTAYTERNTWRSDLISLLMDRSVNVYTDISCASDPGDFEQLKEDLTVGDLRDCRDKVLFGTDFDVVSSGSLSEAGHPVGQTLEFYLANYLRVFGQWEENDGLRRRLEFDNPEAFFRFTE